MQQEDPTSAHALSIRLTSLSYVLMGCFDRDHCALPALWIMDPSILSYRACVLRWTCNMFQHSVLYLLYCPYIVPRIRTYSIWTLKLATHGAHQVILTWKCG